MKEQYNTLQKLVAFYAISSMAVGAMVLGMVLKEEKKERGRE
jgi:phosphotransferase system  glucose/maltose/N-acetylglucosamine-specific IIC component